MIGVREARLNITWKGHNGDFTEPVSFEAANGDLFRWAAEAIRGGAVPGIPADPGVDLRDFVVRRFGATADVPYNRVLLHPKTPFG